MKFSKVDRITAIIKGQGLEDATVTGTAEYNGRECYMLKIACGTALLPICAEVGYKLYKERDVK